MIGSFILIPTATITAMKGEFDKHGTKLWNLTLSLDHQARNSEAICAGIFDVLIFDPLRLILQVRVFSFFMMDCAQRCYHGRNVSSEAQKNLLQSVPASHMIVDDVRVFKSALKATKICVGPS